MTAVEAAARLGVSRATLYAYVSRGHIRSQAMAGRSRARGYAREDVERLRQRTESRRDPEKAAAGALRWGVPVLESAITLIDGSRVYYRGHDAIDLARTRSVEEVAALIWTGRFQPLTTRPRNTRYTRNARSTLSFIARAQRALADAEAGDPSAFDVHPERVASAGVDILSTVVSAATGAPPEGLAIDAAPAVPQVRRAPPASSAPPILCADLS
jgi:citrate synthase